MSIHPRQRQMMQALWRAGRLSRRELHQVTGIRPNTIGTDAAALLRANLVRECETLASARGRPRVPLEIDPSHRHVLGVAIRPGAVQLSTLNLLGQPAGETISRTAASGAELVEAAGSLLKAHINRRTIGVGLSTPGFIDPRERTILFSSATASSGPLSLAPAFEPAGRLPVVLENDMHALAARWLLTRLSPLGEDVLLIYFDDAQVGAAMLIDGRPNRGCVTGANEIGHTRFPVETDECYCGRSGCLERICSTAFVRRIGSDGQTLAEVLADPRGDVARRVVDLLAAGFANVVNFTRANRLVLVSDLLRQASFARLLLETTRSLVLREIESRLRIDLWDQPSAHPGENAGWLALANLYYEGWNR